ncbi:MAG: hypothetical protein KA010_03140 [Saprospiraceae bacterium]|nr:hypothetical protein [Saprospiraceae bacterium]
MKKNITLVLLVFVVALSQSCKNEPKAAIADPQANSTTTTSNADQSTTSEVKYPIVPEDIMKDLWNSADGLDVIFYDLPISISQDNAAATRQSLGYIAAESAPINGLCKSVGRISFKVKGTIKLEAEIYLGPLCNYYVFLDKNNKPVYANKLNQQGIDFYTSIVGSVRQAPAK